MDLELHPGVRIALARGRMDEAQVARAIAAGELVSPQPYGNSWLFNLRITGTGTAYRQALDEYVWRDPSLYLNQGFLDRCNGLPVILEHPNKEMLDSKEYADRNVGSIVYPYIRGEEVWGIARILDQPTAEYMREHQVSTSPAVVFADPGVNETIEVGDGKHLLIEGKPSLLDHLAICEEGVWDKGGPPVGVDSANAMEGVMPEEKSEVTEADARRDAEGDKLDKLLEGIKVLSDRMDSMEAERRDDAAKRKDESAETEARQAKELNKLAEEEEKSAHEEAEKEAEGEKDSHRKDARHGDDEEEGEMPFEEAARKDGESDAAYSKRVDALAKRHDSSYCRRDDESMAAHCDRVAKAVRRDAARRHDRARMDSVDTLVDVVSKLAARVDSIARIADDRPPEDENAFADAQARADAVYQQFGDAAPRPMRGETLVGYRIRLARGMQKHSEELKGIDLGAIARADAAGFSMLEKRVYADAAKASRSHADIPIGTLREVTTKERGGAEKTVFYGDPLTWMSAFMAPGRTTERIGLNPNRR